MVLKIPVSLDSWVLTQLSSIIGPEFALELV